ncbi:MAG: GNAT family N-acetyltransferase, partial [Alphaproteobacteria bacterium]
MSKELLSFRLAAAADVPAVTALKYRAYEGYVALTGVPPLPMAADYGRFVAQAIVWLLVRDDNGLAGALVLQPAADHLLIYSVAVDP